MGNRDFKWKDLITEEERAFFKFGRIHQWKELLRIELELPSSFIKSRAWLIVAILSLACQIAQLLLKVGFYIGWVFWTGCVLAFCALGLCVFYMLKASYDEGGTLKYLKATALLFKWPFKWAWSFITGEKTRSFYEELNASGFAPSKKEYVLCPGPNFRLRSGEHQEVPMTRPHILANLMMKARWPAVKGELHIKFPWERPVEVYYGETLLPGGTGRIPPPVTAC